jgi:hypothetical protein
MKYQIICAIEVEAKSKEQAQNAVDEVLKGKAKMLVDYIEEVENA